MGDAQQQQPLALKSSLMGDKQPAQQLARAHPWVTRDYNYNQNNWFKEFTHG